MSGKRTKALRRYFAKLAGHAPVTETKTAIGQFVRSVFDRARGKRVRESFPQKVAIYARNGFRRFKRSGRTGAQIIADRADFRKRREVHRMWVERNNERIAEGIARRAVA